MRKRFTINGKKVGFADSIFIGRLSCYSGNIVSDISYIIAKDRLQVPLTGSAGHTPLCRRSFFFLSLFLFQKFFPDFIDGLDAIFYAEFLVQPEVIGFDRIFGQSQRLRDLGIVAAPV